MTLVLILLVFFIGVFFLARLIFTMGEAEASDASSGEEERRMIEAHG